jgi:hypothetical protein
MNGTFNIMKRISFLQVIVWLFNLSLTWSFQIGSICTVGQFFDSTMLECRSCPITMIPSIDGKNRILKIIPFHK